jgi:multicomponent Na+:H+ antiporter subunit D
MLAYSSISQVGYIIVGLGCATPLGIFGAVFHLFNHAVFKSALFINSAALEAQTGMRDMDRMGGLGAKMPVTGLTSVISCLSAAGIPPLAGFWSKLIIIIALWVSGYYTYAVIAMIAGTITLAYFLSMQRRVFFGTLAAEFSTIQEAPFGLLLPVLILTVITVALGLLFPFLPGIPTFYR